MGNKVICGACVHEIKGICEIKKVSIKINKKRMCDKHCTDTSKIKFKQEIPTVRRPDWFWDREERRRLRRELLQKINESVAENAKREVATVNAKDIQHPLTGDLSRFQTTAGTEENKKEK